MKLKDVYVVIKKVRNVNKLKRQKIVGKNYR